MRSILKIAVCLLSFSMVSVGAEQKVVLISGGTGGIGIATIKAFEEKGWKVWAGYRNQAPENSLNVRWIPLDVMKDQMIQDALETILEEDGEIHALVNNAGYAIIGLEEGICIEEAQRLFDVNFFGSLRLIQKVIPQMRAQKFGHIINISSTSGVRAIPGLGLYAASKFALEGLSEALAVSLSPWNIQVSIIEPGTVKNDFAKHCVISEEPSDNPLAIALSQNLSSKLASLATQGQDCGEIGRLIVEVAETSHPDLRYQTSSKVQDTVSKKLVDLSGNKMREEQKTFFKSLVE